MLFVKEDPYVLWHAPSLPVVGSSSPPAPHVRFHESLKGGAGVPS